MIKVIHICHSNDSFAANYANRLCKSFGERVHTRITDSPVELKEMCKTLMPDIIHQHGHVDYELPKGCHARKVLTPHGATFSSYNGFYAILARSKMEARAIDSPRTEIIRNPIITKTVDFDEIAEFILRIYQRVMDTNVLELMSDDTQQALRLLLKAGTTGDRRWLGDMQIPSSPDFRQLAIYAYYENVEEELQRGAEIMDIELPTMYVDMKTSYLPRDYHRPDKMDEPLVPTILESVADNNMNLRLLVDLDRALRDDNLDEEELMKKMAEQQRAGLLLSLLQVLKEQLLTEEGFLPGTPIDNRETQRLRNLLSSHLKV